MQGGGEGDFQNEDLGDAFPQNLINQSRLIKVNLSKIVGLHSAVASAYWDLSIPPLRFPVLRAGGDKQLRAVLSRTLIRVARENGRLRCIGNVRTFLAMRATLSDDPEVTCVEVFGISAAKIRANCIADFLYEPAIAGIHFSETRILCDVARRAVQAGLWTTQQPVEIYIANLFDVDRRQLTRKTAKGEVAPEATPSFEPTIDDECSTETESLIEPENASVASSPSTDPQPETVTKQEDPPQKIYEIRLGGVKLGLFTPENPVSINQLMETVRGIVVLPVVEHQPETAQDARKIQSEMIEVSDQPIKTQGAL